MPIDAVAKSCNDTFYDPDLAVNTECNASFALPVNDVGANVEGFSRVLGINNARGVFAPASFDSSQPSSTRLKPQSAQVNRNIASDFDREISRQMPARPMAVRQPDRDRDRDRDYDRGYDREYDRVREDEPSLPLSGRRGNAPLRAASSQPLTARHGVARPSANAHPQDVIKAYARLVAAESERRANVSRAQDRLSMAEEIQNLRKRGNELEEVVRRQNTQIRRLSDVVKRREAELERVVKGLTLTIPDPTKPFDALALRNTEYTNPSAELVKNLKLKVKELLERNFQLEEELGQVRQSTKFTHTREVEKHLRIYYEKYVALRERNVELNTANNALTAQAQALGDELALARERTGYLTDRLAKAVAASRVSHPSARDASGTPHDIRRVLANLSDAYDDEDIFDGQGGSGATSGGGGAGSGTGTGAGVARGRRDGAPEAQEHQGAWGVDDAHAAIEREFNALFNDPAAGAEAASPQDHTRGSREPREPLAISAETSGLTGSSQQLLFARMVAIQRRQGGSTGRGGSAQPHDSAQRETADIAKYNDMQLYNELCSEQEALKKRSRSRKPSTGGQARQTPEFRSPPVTIAGQTDSRRAGALQAAYAPLKAQHTVAGAGSASSAHAGKHAERTTEGSTHKVAGEDAAQRGQYAIQTPQSDPLGKQPRRASSFDREAQLERLRNSCQSLSGRSVQSSSSSNALVANSAVERSGTEKVLSAPRGSKNPSRGSSKSSLVEDAAETSRPVQRGLPSILTPRSIEQLARKESGDRRAADAKDAEPSAHMNPHTPVHVHAHEQTQVRVPPQPLEEAHTANGEEPKPSVSEDASHLMASKLDGADPAERQHTASLKCPELVFLNSAPRSNTSESQDGKSFMTHISNMEAKLPESKMGQIGTKSQSEPQLSIHKGAKGSKDAKDAKGKAALVHADARKGSDEEGRGTSGKHPVAEDIPTATLSEIDTQGSVDDAQAIATPPVMAVRPDMLRGLPPKPKQTATHDAQDHDDLLQSGEVGKSSMLASAGGMYKLSFNLPDMTNTSDRPDDTITDGLDRTHDEHDSLRISVVDPKQGDDSRADGLSARHSINTSLPVPTMMSVHTRSSSGCDLGDGGADDLSKEPPSTLFGYGSESINASSLQAEEAPHPPEDEAPLPRGEASIRTITEDSLTTSPKSPANASKQSSSTLQSRESDKVLGELPTAKAVHLSSSVFSQDIASPGCRDSRSISSVRLATDSIITGSGRERPDETLSLSDKGSVDLPQGEENFLLGTGRLSHPVVLSKEHPTAPSSGRSDTKSGSLSSSKRASQGQPPQSPLVHEATSEATFDNLHSPTLLGPGSGSGAYKPMTGTEMRSAKPEEAGAAPGAALEGQPKGQPGGEANVAPAGAEDSVSSLDLDAIDFG